jgi:ArsR family transcriptional regulator
MAVPIRHVEGETAMTAKEAAFVLRALGDGTRLRILGALFQGEQTPAGLTTLLRCPQTRVSRHLAYLRARGLVESRVAGGRIAYRLMAPSNGLVGAVLEAVRERLGDLEEVRADMARLGRKGGKRATR